MDGMTTDFALALWAGCAGGFVGFCVALAAFIALGERFWRH